MRINDFFGIYPKTMPEKLKEGAAIFAKNIEFYSGGMKPCKSDLKVKAVNDTGKICDFEINGIIPVGLKPIVFNEYTFWAIDHSSKEGSDGVIFSKNGKIYRTNNNRIANNTPPQELGIEPPKDLPVVFVVENGGKKIENEEKECLDSKDCDENKNPDQIFAFAYTWISECNCDYPIMESPPSQITDVIEVKNGDSVLMQVDFSKKPDNASGVRWYAVIAGEKGEAKLRFIGESSSNFFEWDINQDWFQEPIETEDHFPPSGCVNGVAGFGSSRIICFTDYTIQISENRLPHAYPMNNRHTLPDRIIAVVGVEDDNKDVAYVLTDKSPYIIEENDGYHIVKRINIDAPISSKSAWMRFENSILYSGSKGLIYLKDKLIKNISENHFSEREWSDYQPKIIGGALSEILTGKARKNLLIYLSEYSKDKDFHIINSEINPNAIIGINENIFYSTGKNLFAFKKSNEEKNIEYHSQVFFSHSKITINYGRIIARFKKIPDHAMGAMRIYKDLILNNHISSIDDFIKKFPEFEKSKDYLGNDDCGIYFKLYCDDKLIYKNFIYSHKPFRLPRKYGLRWRFEVSSNIEIQEIELNTSKTVMSLDK